MPDQAPIQVNPMTYTPAPTAGGASGQILADSLSNTIGIAMWAVAGIAVVVGGAFLWSETSKTSSRTTMRLSARANPASRARRRSRGKR